MHAQIHKYILLSVFFVAYGHIVSELTFLYWISNKRTGLKEKLILLKTVISCLWVGPHKNFPFHVNMAIILPLFWILVLFVKLFLCLSGFHSLVCPGTSCVDQAGLRLTVILGIVHVPQTPSHAATSKRHCFKTGRSSLLVNWA